MNDECHVVEPLATLDDLRWNSQLNLTVVFIKGDERSMRGGFPGAALPATLLHLLFSYPPGVELINKPGRQGRLYHCRLFRVRDEADTLAQNIQCNVTAIGEKPCDRFIDVAKRSGLDIRPIVKECKLMM